MSRITQKSFTGGELSPSLYARNDLAKYANGLKILKNGFVRAEGCVSNRAGLEVVCEVKDSSKPTRIIPFAFNTEQTYIIEMGEKYFRYIKDGGEIIYPEGNPKAGEIVETVTPYETKDLFLLKYGQNADVLTICNRNYVPQELSRMSHYDWSIKPINSKPLIEPPTGVAAKWTGSTAENSTDYKYVVTAVLKETYEESTRSEVVTTKGHLEAYWTTKEYMTITWEAVENAVEYNIYRSVNGVFGFIGTSTELTFKDSKIEPDLHSTAPISRDPFENGNNPSCVNYYQQRKLFGCLKNDPQNLVTSQTGTDTNFNISRPLNASDSLTIRLSEREVNEIRHLVGLTDLIVLTSGAEWKLKGADGALSASDPPVCVPQSYYGSSNIQPCVSGNQVLYVQAGGSVVRDLGYDFASDGYDGDELTIFASHLFENKQIVDMAYSKEPYRILWCVMSDGTLNALTYNKKQEVAGWHRHETKGKFESVAVIREGFEDVAYFVVSRKIGGVTKRFIERMHSRLINNTQDGFFVDCGLSGEFPEEVSQISGLDYLEGEEVVALADGGVVTGLKVQNGTIELPHAAKRVTIGLPYEFELETLSVEGDNTQGLKKIINEISIKVDKSREDFWVLGTKGDVSIIEQNSRSLASIDDANELYSGDIIAFPLADYTENATIHIKQPYPLPLTITSLSAVVTVEEIETDVQISQQ